MGDPAKRDPRLRQHPLNSHRYPSHGRFSQDLNRCATVDQSPEGFDDCRPFDVGGRNSDPCARSKPDEKLHRRMRP